MIRSSSIIAEDCQIASTQTDGANSTQIRRKSSYGTAEIKPTQKRICSII